MKTKAVRIYGKKDLRLEEFNLPEIKDDEILARVISDSICMSSYKAAILGTDHKRIPHDVNINPTIIGHEFSGVILETGRKWEHRYKKGQKFCIQPAMVKTGTLNAPGYSYKYIGGAATNIIIPCNIIEADCLLDYEGEAFFPASLAEPMSCIVGAYHASYHVNPGTYEHKMGIKEKGNLAILGGAGPMGLGAIDYALHSETRPSVITVTDTNNERLARAESLLPGDMALKEGIKLKYINPTHFPDTVEYLRSLTEGKGYDDVFIFTPVKEVVELGDSILAADGCLNFFAGPTDNNFKAECNFYNVHYAFTHIIGTTGGNTEDLKEALEMIKLKKLNPAIMITHIGGLDSVVETTLSLPDISGGKKLIYTNISMPLLSLNDLGNKKNENSFYAGLYKIVSGNNYIWSEEAEKFLLKNAQPI